MSLTIVQDNKQSGVDLLAINNPLSFIVEATYTGITPDYIPVDLYFDGEIIASFKALSYKDSAPLTRQFVFLADEIIRGYMDDLNDFAQASGTMQPLENITKEFQVVFTYQNQSVSITFVACNGVRQFGDEFGACMVDVNNNKTYTAGENGTVYLYFYNDNENNVITVDGITFETNYIIDYNGDRFTDSNSDLLTGIDY